MSLEILARLVPSGAKWDATTPSTSPSKLSSLDLNLTLSLLPAPEEQLVRIIYMQQYELVGGFADTLSPKFPWPKAALLINLKLAELLSPKLCKSCGGDGYMITGGVPVACRACSGTGFKSVSEAERARRFGITKANWYKTWYNRYRGVCSHIDQLHTSAEINFKKLLRKGY